MNNLLFLISIMVIVVIIIHKTRFLELFKVVAYNSNDNAIPQYDIETPYEQLVYMLQKNISNIRLTTHPTFILQKSQNYTTSFTKIPDVFVLNFPFASIFKNILTEQVINQLNISIDFKNSKFELFTNPSNIYYNDFTPNTREYLFSIILHNAKLSFTTNLLIYLTLDNLTSFMIDDNIITLPNNNDIYINHIEIQPFQETLHLTPFSNNVESYYLMNTNKLYLFKTILKND
jgi:hypothetical protein